MVTLPFSVREGINIFLAGFVPTENLRFREEALSFKVRRLAGWLAGQDSQGMLGLQAGRMPGLGCRGWGCQGWECWGWG